MIYNVIDKKRKTLTTLTIKKGDSMRSIKAGVKTMCEFDLRRHGVKYINVHKKDRGYEVRADKGLGIIYRLNPQTSLLSKLVFWK